MDKNTTSKEKSEAEQIEQLTKELQILKSIISTMVAGGFFRHEADTYAVIGLLTKAGFTITNDNQQQG